MPRSTTRTTEEKSIKDAPDAILSALADAGFTIPAVGQRSLAGGVTLVTVPQTASDRAWNVSHNNPVFRRFTLPAPERTDRGSSEGSVFTARFVSGGFTVAEAVDYLIEEGWVESAVKAEMGRSDLPREDAEAAVSMALARVAVGWVAERITADSDRFAKMSEENDMAGQDFYDRNSDELVQLRRWTFGRWHAGAGETTDENGNPIVYYADIGGEVVYSRDYTDLTADLREYHGVTNDELETAWFLFGQLPEI